MHPAIVSLTIVVIAAAASSVSRAETPVSPSRHDYDSYLTAFTMEQHVISCRKYAPGVYSSLAEAVERWRSENNEIMLHSEAAARSWPLPGGQSIDAILDTIRESMDRDYADGKGPFTDARCKRLLERLSASTSD